MSRGKSVKDRVRRRVRRVAGQPELKRRVVALEKELARTQRRLARIEKRAASERREARIAARGRGGSAPQLGVAEVAPTPAVEDAVVAVDEQGLSYLGRPALRTLATAVADLEAEGLPGIIVEAGTALGGSAIVIALTKAKDRRLVAYDMFGMIPPPGDKDGDDVHERYETIKSGQSAGRAGATYYGYRDDLLGDVTRSFAHFGVPIEDNSVELVAGLFQDTVGGDEPIALVHLDGDWYESTMVCLERLAPRIVPGGRFVIDDYFAWSGCRTAIEEYFEGRDEWVFERHAKKIHILRS